MNLKQIDSKVLEDGTTVTEYKPEPAQPFHHKASLKVYKKANGDRTVTCGVWILMRQQANQTTPRLLDGDAPFYMIEAAEELLKLES